MGGIIFKNLNFFLNLQLLWTDTTKRIQYKVKFVQTKSIASLEELEKHSFAGQREQTHQARRWRSNQMNHELTQLFSIFIIGRRGGLVKGGESVK